MRLLFFKKITLRVLITICSIIPIEAFAFDMQVGGWREFKFGTDWSDATGQLKQRCQTYDVASSDDVWGYTCGSWLGINVNVRIRADEGALFGFGRELSQIIITAPFSDSAGNKIVSHLRKHFEVTTDYECWLKTQDDHGCRIIFNDTVIFSDYKIGFVDRTLSVALSPY